MKGLSWREKTESAVAAIVAGIMLCILVKVALDDWRVFLDALLHVSYACLWTAFIVSSLFGLLSIYKLFRTSQERGNS